MAEFTPSQAALLAHWEQNDALQYAFRWLRKDGLDAGFYEFLLAQAPETSLALAAHGVCEHLIPFAEALKLPPAERKQRLFELELDAVTTWRAARPMVRPEDLGLLESWVSRCVSVERPTPVSSTDQRVRSTVFGPGTIVASTGKTVTVRFDTGETKKLGAAFVEPLAS